MTGIQGVIGLKGFAHFSKHTEYDFYHFVLIFQLVDGFNELLPGKDQYVSDRTADRFKRCLTKNE